MAADGAADATRSGGDGDVHRSRDQRPSVTADEGLALAVRGLDRLVREPALVTQPGLVHRVVPPRDVPVDPVARHAHVHVAAHRTPGADAGNVVQEPDPHLEAEVLRGEGTDGAHIGHVHRVVVVEGRVREGRDHRAVAAARHHELPGTRHLATEAHATPAEDAALLVEHDGRAEVHVLRQRATGLLGARLADAVLEGVVLELALARLVADRAVEGVVDEQQLHHALTGAPHPLRRRVHDHAVLHGRVAGDLELRHALHLDLAQPTRTVDR
jgi:hypothetical protein